MNSLTRGSFHKTTLISWIVIAVTLQLVNGQSYRIPRPTVTALSPRGFRVSIPDHRGTVLFAFHGSVNKSLRPNEAGDYHGETRSKSRNEWVYENTRYHFQRGDVLNFWVYVQNGDLGYVLENQQYTYPDDFGSQTNTQSSNHNQGAITYEDNTYEQTNDNRQQTKPSSSMSTDEFLSGSLPTSNQNVDWNQHTQIPTVSTNDFLAGFTNTANKNQWNQNSQNNQYQGNQNNGDRWNQNSQGNQNQGGLHWNQNSQGNQNHGHQNNGDRWNQNSQGNQNNGHHNQYNTERTTTPYTAISYEDDFVNRPTTQRTTSRTTHRGQRPSPTRTTTPQSNNNYWPGTTSERHPTSDRNRCMTSITTVNGRAIDCKGTLLFEEQFNGDIMQKWSPDIRMPLETEDAEFVLYHKYPSVWNASYGNLNIFPKLLYKVPESGFSESDIRTGRFVIDPRECSSMLDPKQECERQAGSKKILPPVVTAKFRSMKSFNFKFGRVEIRAKFPKGDWIFPQLFLEPTDNVYRGLGDSAYLNGQVRMAFIHGNEYLEKQDGIPLDGKILIGTTIIAPGDTVREITRRSVHFNSDHLGNDFHTYSIMWTNTSIKFSIDGLEYGTDTGNYKQLKTVPNAKYWESGTNMAPFDQEFHISLGVGVGGNADFPEDSVTGLNKVVKPWENTSPKAELNFYLNVDEWYSTWNSQESGLIVDYVKVWSV